MGTGEQLGEALEVSQPFTGQTYEFKHFDPEGERELIEAITLDTDKIDGLWMEALDHFLELGKPRETLPHLVGVQEMRQKRRARACVERELGVNDPAHDLYQVFAKLRLRPSSKGIIIPSTLVTAIRALSDIAGNVTGAIQLLNEVPTLATYSGDVIQSRRAYGQRVAAALRWQGDVDELIREFPRALLFGNLGKIMLVARMAEQNGTPGHRKLSGLKVFHLLQRPIEPQINAIIYDREKYTLGKSNCAVAKTVRGHQEFLYKALKDPCAAKRIGHKVLWSYFQFRPLAAKDQRAFPYLQPFIETLKDISVRNEWIPQVITGEEVWARALIPKGRLKRDYWLYAINSSIAEGSLSIERKGPEYPYYREIVEARYAFFRLLGWNISRHPLVGALNKLMERKSSLVAPEKAVEILNLLTSYGVTALTSILMPDLGILRLDTASIKAKLDTIVEAGYDVATFAGLSQALRQSQEKLLMRLKAA